MNKPRLGRDHYAKKGFGKALTVYVGPETHQALKKLAEMEERSLQTYVRRVLDDHAARKPS